MRTTSIIFLFTLFFLILLVSGTHAQIGFYETIVNDTLYSIKISNSDNSNYRYKISELNSLSKSIDSINIITFEEDIFKYKINHSNFFNSDSALKVQLINKFWNQVHEKISAAKLEKELVKKTKEAEELENKLTEKENIIARLAERNVIATIKLNPNAKKLNVTNKRDDRNKCGVKDTCTIKTTNSLNFKPENIKIAFENGIIKDIQVVGEMYGKKKTFSNTKLIRIRSINDYINLNTVGYCQLECSLEEKFFEPKCEFKQNSIAVFNLSDLLFFEIERLSGSGTYIPVDTTINIKVSKDTLINIKGKSMMDNLDMRLYTDITGFDSKNVNGKFQFELRYNLHINTSLHGNRWLLFERVSPFLNLSKVGENNIKLALDNPIPAAEITQFNLLEYSYLFSGIDLNIIKRSGSTVAYSLNLLGGIYRTTLSSTNNDTSIVIRDNTSFTKDTTITQTEITNNTNSWFWGVNLTATVFENRNFNMDFSSSILNTGLFKSEYGIKPNYVWVISVLVGMNYFPNEYNKTTALFFRTRFYKTTDNGNNNLNIETGIYLPLTKFFSSFGI